VILQETGRAVAGLGVMMKAKPARNDQGNFLYNDLIDQLNPKDPLLKLAIAIPWERFEQEFSGLYSEHGRPAKPIRLMVGLMILKQLENLSDERVIEAWVRNPYYQAFCGETHFQWKFPCDPTELVYFRKRIGEDGTRLIFEVSVGLHGDDAKEREITVDTTVQEKNITFPTDVKLLTKIIKKCRKIAADEGVRLRRSFSREFKSSDEPARTRSTACTSRTCCASARARSTRSTSLGARPPSQSPRPPE
jgi:IS5 family transposase